MTAEVAILNRGALALAADSAVTLGGVQGKIYNTANKLFALSRIHPVAVMVYGSGSFGTIPWETAIKEYRRQLGADGFSTVAEYADDFEAYLAALGKRAIDVEEQRDLVRWVATWELDRLKQVVEDRAQQEGEPATQHDDDALGQILATEIERRIKDLESTPYVSGLSGQVAGQELTAAVGDFRDFAEAIFAPLLHVDQNVLRRARVLVRASIRTPSRSPWSSGVVITGFGEDQLFPALSHMLIDGLVAGRLRSQRLLDEVIGERSSAAIYPFAQEEMMSTFMEGVHPDYRVAVEAFVDRAMSLFVNHFGATLEPHVATSVLDTLRAQMDRARQTLLTQFQHDFDDYLRRVNSEPIMSIVELLPKEDLAEMAEALVNLTSFKRKVTPEAETVGGPIDVAVVSKGDGLVWIRRKHYFDPALNHRFFDRDSIQAASLGP